MPARTPTTGLSASGRASQSPPGSYRARAMLGALVGALVGAVALAGALWSGSHLGSGAWRWLAFGLVCASALGLPLLIDAALRSRAARLRASLSGLTLTLERAHLLGLTSPGLDSAGEPLGVLTLVPDPDRAPELTGSSCTGKTQRLRAGEWTGVLVLPVLLGASARLLPTGVSATLPSVQECLGAWERSGTVLTLRLEHDLGPHGEEIPRRVVLRGPDHTLVLCSPWVSS